MLAVHCDVDVITVCNALEERATFVDMEREWRRTCSTQTVVHSSLCLVQSSFVKFVRTMTDVSIFSASPSKRSGGGGTNKQEERDQNDDDDDANDAGAASAVVDEDGDDRVERAARPQNKKTNRDNNNNNKQCRNQHQHQDDDKEKEEEEEADFGDDRTSDPSSSARSRSRSPPPSAERGRNNSKIRRVGSAAGSFSGTSPRDRNSPPHPNAAPKPLQIPIIVIRRCFDELDIGHNGKLSWSRFRCIMTLVAEMRRCPPLFCSRRQPLVCDMMQGVKDISMCAVLPQWRMVAISSGKADGKIHLVDATGSVRSTMQNPKQKGLITGVFLVSLPRMVKNGSGDTTSSSIQVNSSESTTAAAAAAAAASSSKYSEQHATTPTRKSRPGASINRGKDVARSFSSSKNGGGRGGEEENTLLASSAFPQLVTSATDGSIVVWDLDRNGDLDSSRPPQQINVERPIVSLAFDKNSSLFFALVDNGSLVSVEWIALPGDKEHSLRIRTCRLLMEPVGPHTSHPSCLTVVPVLSQVATAGEDAIVALWRSADLTCVCRVVAGSGPRAAIKSLLVLPKMSRVLAVHHSKNITCWDVGSMLLEGKDTVGVLKGAHAYPVVGAFADEFGDYVVSVDTSCTICVWNARNMLLLERTEAPLSKWDKRSLASMEVTCAAYDPVMRDLTVFAGSRLRKFSGIASGLCAPRADQPFESVVPPALLGRQLLGRSSDLTRLVEIDEAASLLVYVTAWDVGFFSLLDGALVAYVSTRDIFGASIGDEGVTHAFLSHLPPSRRLASDVAASMLSLADAAGRVVAGVPASIVQAETSQARLECFRRVVLNTASPVNVKLEPAFPVPGSPSLVIPSLFGVFLFAFRGCMIALSHSCIMTCVLKRDAHRRDGGDGDDESEARYLVLEPVSFQSFQGLSIAPVIVRRGKAKSRPAALTPDAVALPSSLSLSFSLRTVPVPHVTISAATSSAASRRESLVLDASPPAVNTDVHDAIASSPASVALQPTRGREQDDDGGDDGGGGGGGRQYYRGGGGGGLSDVSSCVEQQHQHGEYENNNNDDHDYEEPTTTTYTRKLRHVRVNSGARFFSMCFHGVRQVTLFQYNRTSATPNSTDLVIREACFDWDPPSHSCSSSATARGGSSAQNISETTHPHLFPTSSLESIDDATIAGSNLPLLFVTYGNDRLVAFAMQRNHVVPILQVHSLDAVFGASSLSNVVGAATIRQWRMSMINAGGIGRHLVLVPVLEEGADTSLLQNVAAKQQQQRHAVSQTAALAGSNNNILFESSVTSLGNEAASDCLVLPTSWFVDTFVAARKADTDVVLDPVVPGTCLVFKPSLASHFDGHSLPENLHQSKSECVLIPCTVGDEGPAVLVKIYSDHKRHTTTIKCYREVNARARRCLVRMMHTWDLSEDALPHRVALPPELDPSILHAAVSQQHNNNNNNTTITASSTRNGDLASSINAASQQSFSPESSVNLDSLSRKQQQQRKLQIQQKERDLQKRQQRAQAASEPPPLRAIVTELGRSRLRDLLHSPIIERTHVMLSVVDCLSELAAAGWTCLDISPNSIVQTVDGHWKLSSLHAIRRIPTYSDKPEYNCYNDAAVLYPWYCDGEFAAQWVKRNGQPVYAPSALWATGCLAFEMAMQSLPFQVETPPHGFFELADIMHGLSVVVASTVREVMAAAKRKIAETFQKKDQGYATIMLDFATLCLLPSVQSQANFSYVTRQLRAMIEATSAEHHRDEVIRRCDRELAIFGAGEHHSSNNSSSSSSASGAHESSSGNSNNSSTKSKVQNDLLFLVSSVASADLKELAKNVVAISACSEVPWFTPDLGKHFLIAPEKVSAVVAGSTVIVAITIDRFPNGRLSDSSAFDPFLASSRRESSSVAHNSNSNKAPSSGFAGLFEVAGAALMAQKVEDSQHAFIAPPSGVFVMPEEDRRRQEQLDGLRRQLNPPSNNHSSADFSAVCGNQGRLNNNTATSGGGGNNNNCVSGVFANNSSYVCEPRTGSMVLLYVDVKEGSAGGGSGSRLARHHIVNCGAAPPPLFGRFPSSVVKWSMPLRCIGASSRLTIATAPSAGAQQWMAREYGTVSNAPTPFAESFAVALLPPDLAALGTSIAPGDECNFAKLSHSCLERAVVGNWESFTTGEMQALFKEVPNAPSERATMEAWERNLARRAPYFACAIEAVAHKDAENKAAVRLGKAMEITQNSHRGLLDALSLAQKSNLRRLLHTRSKSRRSETPKAVSSPSSSSFAATPNRSSGGGKTPLGKLKSSVK